MNVSSPTGFCSIREEYIQSYILSALEKVINICVRMPIALELVFHFMCCVCVCIKLFLNIQEQVSSSMLEENNVSSGKEMLVFHINDTTEISVKCIGSVVGRVKDIIRYHTVMKVISAEFVKSHDYFCARSSCDASVTEWIYSETILHILHNTSYACDYQCELSYKLILDSHGPGHVLVRTTISCFLKRFKVHHSYKLLVFGHGSGHILMCIVAGLLAAATGLFLLRITKNLLSGLLCPFICSAQQVIAVAHAPGLSYDR